MYYLFYKTLNSFILYSFYRFMGDSKWSVKNKARVEGSICAFYLHRETTYFCSHYFKNFMLSPRNRRNEILVQGERCPSMLSIFNVPGRHAGKKSIHWLTQKEWNSIHMHVLINCTKVKPYLEWVIQIVDFICSSFR